jgi:hypothetical protein
VQPNRATNKLQLSRDNLQYKISVWFGDENCNWTWLIWWFCDVACLHLQNSRHQPASDVATMCPACFLLASHCEQGPSITKTTKYQFCALWTTNRMHFGKKAGDGQIPKSITISNLE